MSSHLLSDVGGMRIPEYWRLNNERYKLKCQQPQGTNVVAFPPRPVTPRPVEIHTFNDDDNYQLILAHAIQGLHEK